MMEQLLKELQQEDTQQQGLFSHESIDLELFRKFNKSSLEIFNDFLKVKGRTLKEASSLEMEKLMCEYYTKHVNAVESATVDPVREFISSDNDVMLLQSRKRGADEMHNLLIKKSKTDLGKLKATIYLKKKRFILTLSGLM